MLRVIATSAGPVLSYSDTQVKKMRKQLGPTVLTTPPTSGMGCNRYVNTIYTYVCDEGTYMHISIVELLAWDVDSGGVNSAGALVSQNS